MAVAEPAVVEFAAMGSPCRIVVEHGLGQLAQDVAILVDDLEARWSRFRDDSEVSAINRADGHLCVVSEATFDLVERAERARHLTGGRFNPLMLDQIEAAGYRRSWSDAPPGALADGGGCVAQPGSEAPIALYPEISGVRLPPGVRFDPGGVGKGLAVDRAIERCRQGGSAFASVELGGDLRVYGSPWYGPRWEIGVADPFDPGADVATLIPADGAVTTSTTAKRRWFDGRRWCHHLLDPATGRPAVTDLIAVATVSSEAWWAEVAAKTGVLAGSAAVVETLRDLGTPGVAVTVDGSVITVEDRPATGDRRQAGIGAAS